MKSDLKTLMETIAALRGKNGCPWDKKQTPHSLVKYLRLEVDELIEAIQKSDTVNTCEEIGDVLFILLMLTEIHRHQGDFTLKDVVREVNDKLIRRHPHVFKGTPYKDEAELKQQWAAIKAEEKRRKYPLT
ncbi:MAG: nucleotide pyrophosphohydrolase [Deltaproteobacteria bacterium]|nr:MAG: nucleotide pyrophosphohydrolase [Deltaproteobacteria bacterium]